MFTIGTLKLNSRLILAPMAGISDLPFRLLNRRFGCELAFTEMINCRSLSHKSRRTQQMLSSGPIDRPLGVQILGREPRFILKALDVLRDYKFDLLDFNAACPAKKVVRRGEGAGLLKDSQRLKSLFRLIAENSRLPVTVKIRTGWDANSVNAREVALLAEDAGVQGIFIHGRTKTQGYSGKADYQAISQVKKAVSIPVIASGDILSKELAEKMFEETGCDGIVIARGALGNPWIFKDLDAFFKGRPLAQGPGPEERTRVMLEHLRMCVDFYGERNGVVIFRKFFIWYTKGLRRVRALREESSRVKTGDEMIRLVKASGEGVKTR